MFPINTRANQISFFLSPFALECLPASFGAFFVVVVVRMRKKKKKKVRKSRTSLGWPKSLRPMSRLPMRRARLFFFASYLPDLTDTPAYAVQQSTATLVFPSRKLLEAHNKPLTQLCTIRPSRRVCGSRRWARTRKVLGHLGRTDDDEQRASG